MRSVLLALVALALLGGGAWASVPDPDYCTVMNPDSWTVGKLVGVPPDEGYPSRADGDITVFAAAYGGTPIGGVEVTVVINANCEMCICDTWEQTVVTNNDPESADYGTAVLNLRWGGCCQMVAAATIYIDGTPIRSYDVINSPDYNSQGTPSSNCIVNLEDFGEFARNYGDPNPCTDYIGDLLDSNLEDFGLFARHYGDGCVPAP